MRLTETIAGNIAQKLLDIFGMHSYGALATYGMVCIRKSSVTHKRHQHLKRYVF